MKQKTNMRKHKVKKTGSHVSFSMLVGYLSVVKVTSSSATAERPLKLD